ncbi:MAG: 30S ribosomal protein S2, partial [Parcubacteria group bacterium RIFOXYD2_FULL_52_8]
METSVQPNKEALVEALFTAGAQFGFSRSRRHPSTSAYIYGVKNRVEIIDLEKSADALARACEFVTNVAKKREKMLFVANKLEAKALVREAAERLQLPYVKERWLGGTMTNWTEMKKRIARLEDMSTKRENNELGMYTKKERLLIDREIAHLERFFGGLVSMGQLPSALFVVDPREEKTAMHEARALHIPVVALAGTDCDISQVAYPIVVNDSSRTSIAYV